MSARHYPPLEARFWSRVVKTDGCWLWTGATFRFGHGSISRNGRNDRAHRVSWEIHNGPIPPGAWVLHTCDVPACVNPAHLFIGDNVANTADRDAKGRHGSSRKTHCKRGHELAGDNLYAYPGRRICMECVRIRGRQHRRAVA